MSRVLFCVLVAILLLLLTNSIQISAQEEVQPNIDEIRNQARRQVEPSTYAALINFAVNPDVSTATYYIDEDIVNDPTLTVYRIPLQYEFTLNGHNWRPLVQANFAYQKLDTDFEIEAVGKESIDAKWTTFGGTLSVGAKVPVSQGLNLVSVI